MIGLLGAGALGRLWAARLPVGQVVYLPRPGQPAPTLAYTLEVPGGQSLRTRVPALSTPGDLSLLLVTTKAGDALPADGVVVKGEGTVDESRVTGEV